MKNAPNTRTRESIGSLIDAHISGSENTMELAKAVVDSIARDAVQPSEPATPTTPAPQTTVPPAPHDEPHRVNEGADDVSAYPTVELAQRLADITSIDYDTVQDDLDAMIDQGVVPTWLSNLYGDSPFAEYEGDELIISFGDNSNFIKFLNDVSSGAGDAIMKIWSDEHYGAGL